MQLHGCCGSSSKQQSIDAPTSWTGEEDKQKDKAVDYGRLAMILNREKAAGGVRHEVAHGHFAAGDKASDTGQEANSDKQSASEYNPGAEQTKGILRRPLAAQRKP